MGERQSDVILKEFWRINDRFADLFNTVVFGGKCVLKAEELQEMDTDVSSVLDMKEYRQTLSRTRDVVKKTAGGIDFMIIGIESQKKIHYGMPLRHMIYDAMGYLKEYEQLTYQYKKEKKKGTVDEFLSKMKKEDRLHPIITLTIYYGEKRWDGPHSLKDMIIEMPKEVEKVFSNYHMNLLEVRNSGSYQFHNEDVQTVFELSRETFDGKFEEIRKKYQEKKLTPELLEVIGTIVGSKELVHMKEDKEVDSMCTALERLKEESKMEGKIVGLEEGKRVGLEEGKMVGLKEGRQEEQKNRISIMLEKGYPISEISLIFQLSEEEIIKLTESRK